MLATDALENRRYTSACVGGGVEAPGTKKARPSQRMSALSSDHAMGSVAQPIELPLADGSIPPVVINALVGSEEEDMTALLIHNKVAGGILGWP
jgi:hypothetical protein